MSCTATAEDAGVLLGPSDGARRQAHRAWARATPLRMEAALPLYGHEMGECQLGGEIQAYAVPSCQICRFLQHRKRATSSGREPLQEAVRGTEENPESGLLLDRGPAVPHPAHLPRWARACCARASRSTASDARAEGKQIGYVTSGTMIPYYKTARRRVMEIRLHRRRPASARSVLPTWTVRIVPRTSTLRSTSAASVSPPWSSRCHMRQDAAPYVRPILPDVKLRNRRSQRRLPIRRR